MKDMSEFIPDGPINECPPIPQGEGRTFIPKNGYSELLTQVLTDSGVELGDYDKQLVRHLGDFCDWEMAVTLTSWIFRAHMGGMLRANGKQG